jgi:hypothetical protein
MMTMDVQQHNQTHALLRGTRVCGFSDLEVRGTDIPDSKGESLVTDDDVDNYDFLLP